MQDMLNVSKTIATQRILDFDIENRPLSYWYDGKATAEITAIACSWLDSDEVEVWLLGEQELPEILNNFVERYNEADIVTGHYIRKHDLPIINAHLFEYGLRPLQSKAASDTKLDLITMGSLSLSQESIAAYYGLPEPKHHMDQAAWRDANRLTKAGLTKTRKRVVDDVIQHKALRQALVAKGVLGPPKIWDSIGEHLYEEYTP